ncbi:MAG: ABC transporter ATP-binding protein [Phycisphaerales bacterium]|nr:ABC transporter ATP-binding protein [Phycisphaerales bacterium]
MIRTHDLAKSYRNTPVLRGVSIEVEPGTIHGFVGPNGAGKSTFLKCLVGVVHPDDGEVTIDGLDARRQSVAVRRRVGYAPAETSLYNRMKARELVTFSIRYHPKADVDRAVALLETLGVPPDRRVGALSHGMKRKLLLTQAIASNAPVMILDEPMEALDPEARRHMEGVLREECDKGRTIFLSSHDLFSTERLCSHVAFLHHGRILRNGTVTDMVAGLPGLLHVHLREERTERDLPEGPGFTWTGSGRNWKLQFSGPLEAALQQLGSLPLASVRDDGGNLEDLFDVLYERTVGGDA